MEDSAFSIVVWAANDCGVERAPAAAAWPRRIASSSKMCLRPVPATTRSQNDGVDVFSRKAGPKRRNRSGPGTICPERLSTTRVWNPQHTGVPSLRTTRKQQRRDDVLTSSRDRRIPTVSPTVTGARLRL